jgi:predicted RNase H-like nuclease (RuvC/YqgF family)
MSKMPFTFDRGDFNLEFVNLAEIVLRLKAVKKKDNLSISDIMSKLDEAGSYLSESTVRRVFRDNSENELGFTYARVLKPIADVLLMEEPNDPALLEKNEALHSIIKEKNREIESLTSQADALKGQLNSLRAEYDLRLRFLRDQIELKDKRMDEKDEIIRKLMEKCL